MKRLIPISSFLFLLAACNTKPAETEIKTVQSATVAPVDTAGLAQFQQWKAQNELSSAAVPVQPQQAEAPAEPQVKTVTVIRERVVERQAPVRRQSAPRREQVSKPQPQVSNPEPTPTPSQNNGDVAKGPEGNGNGTSTEPGTPQETAKQGGWSKGAKGAVIGGAGGAVIGAVLNKKNRAAGAVIGGVLGGAVGYGIGKAKDKKEAQ